MKRLLMTSLPLMVLALLFSFVAFPLAAQMATPDSSPSHVMTQYPYPGLNSSGGTGAYDSSRTYSQNQLASTGSVSAGNYTEWYSRGE